MKTFLCLLIFSASFKSDNNGKKRLLNQAYKEYNVEKLDIFFKLWSEEIEPIEDTELAYLNDTIKQAYNVFTSFYKPLNIDSLGGSEMGDFIYENVKYLVVQNFIRIYFTDKIYYSKDESDSIIYAWLNKVHSDDTGKINKLFKKTNAEYTDFIKSHYEQIINPENNQPLLTNSITNFRPQIDCEGKVPVYLNKKYSEIVSDFLGDRHTDLGHSELMSPARAKKMSLQKQLFIENVIKIWYGHWGGYWQLHSYPLATSIIFDKNMEYAKIKFRIVYEGGEAILKNENGNWKFISAQRTWIE